MCGGRGARAPWQARVPCWLKKKPLPGCHADWVWVRILVCTRPISHHCPVSDPLLIARSGDTELALLPSLANGHGCITGTTGTGETITLQLLADRFSRIGVPVFLADVKGDLSGISKPVRLSAGSAISRSLIRGILGSLAGGRRR